MSGWSKAIKQAFSLDTTAYDSGALCAAVYMAVIHRRLPDKDYVLGELLHRRDRDPERKHQDPILENTAISLAAWHERLDIVTRLQAHQPFPPTQHFAIQPFAANFVDQSEMRMHYVNITPESGPKFCRTRDVFSGGEKWHRLPTQHVSTLLISSRSENVEIITALLDAGYKAYGFTLRLAVSNQLPPSLVRRLPEHCTDVDARCAISGHFERPDKTHPFRSRRLKDRRP
ncbi:hypothetical protein B0H66DRAFT_603977 [Apodospora peruviana]|uniref:Uncharacterized protein n=1 Tax=Apodospora peruviana TaxID=516989 RepID=A0AAE0I6J9_9PEZI|nr:hypothetical protein B0H66DRAFT_603977 [Apodospora peruviana]